MVSVILLTKNSEEFIDRVVWNLINDQIFYSSEMEVIIIDNFSTDNTKKWATRFIKRFYEYGPERAAQANYGVNQSYGELIYLTGGDLTRDYDFIQQCVDKINQGYDAVYTSVKTDIDVRHFWGKVKSLERQAYIGTYIESARFFKKSVWKKLGGFDETLINMEEDFQHRLDKAGYKTARITAKEYHLHEDDTLKKIFKKSFYYGKSMKSYLKKHNWRGLKQLNPVRPNLTIFVAHPKLLFGFIIYKIVQYLGGLGGLLCG